MTKEVIFKLQPDGCTRFLQIGERKWGFLGRRAVHSKAGGEKECRVHGDGSWRCAGGQWGWKGDH